MLFSAYLVGSKELSEVKRASFPKHLVFQSNFNGIKDRDFIAAFSLFVFVDMDSITDLVQILNSRFILDETNLDLY